MGELHLPWQLANLLAAGGRVDEALAILEPWAAAGNRTAAFRVIDLLFSSGRVGQLREYAESGNDLFAERRLYELLEKRGQVDEVLDMLRRKADDGSGWYGPQLAEVLARNGRIDELRERIAEGDEYAITPLARLMEEHGDTNEAIELLQRFPNAGDREATVMLAHLLAKQGRNDEAMSYVNTIDIMDPSVGMAALETRIDLFLKQDDADGAIQFLDEALQRDPDYKLLSSLLARVLAQAGRTAELQARAEAGDNHAAREFIRLLAKAGRINDALDFVGPLNGEEFGFRSAVLLDSLADTGNVDELRSAVQAGFPGAAERLARFETAHLATRTEDS
jgi:tetratricopeptide (TPR) repeat protein